MSLEFGLRYNLPEVVKNVFEAIGTLGQYARELQLVGTNTSDLAMLNMILDNLFPSVLDVLVFSDFNSNLLSDASDTLYALIWSRKVRFLQYLYNDHRKHSRC